MDIALIVTGAIELANEIFTLINTKESRKYSEQLVQHRLDLASELAKPMDDQNDFTVEDLERKIAILQDIARGELNALIKNS